MFATKIAKSACVAVGGLGELTGLSHYIEPYELMVPPHNGQCSFFRVFGVFRGLTNFIAL